MAARRLIMAMLVLLVLSTILAALIPVERDRLRDDSSTTTTTEATKPTGQLVRRSIGADDATPERIELSLGDQLELTVESPKLADQVEIPAFGQLADVDPDFPARFDLLVLETGTFPVRLVEAGRVIARIDVSAQDSRPRGADQEPDSSSDSPGSSTETATAGANSFS